MVKNILSLFIVVSLFGFSFAQDHQFKLTENRGTADLTGTVVDIYISSTDQIHFDLDVENVSGNSKDVVATRKIISVPSGWIDEICFGTQCYSTGNSVEWRMPSGDAFPMSDGQVSTANIKIDPSSPNNAIYRYYFGTTQDPYQDSIDLRINNVLSVKDIKRDFALSVSPNPANEFLTIKTSGVESGNLRVMDVLGNVILSESFTGYKSINTSSFKNGVYFVLISGNGIGITNRKVVIRH
jgi:hypothetical protein